VTDIATLELAPAAETGALPVFQVKRLWSRAALARLGHADGQTAVPEHNRDRLCLSLLGVGLEETLSYLHAVQPDFAEFEQWVLSRGGGLPDADAVARFNRAISGDRSDSRPRSPDPVLAPDDLRFFIRQVPTPRCEADFRR